MRRLTVPVERCSKCNASLGTQAQADLFKPDLKCLNCLTNERTEMMLHVLPDPKTRAFNRMDDREQEFVTSLRTQWPKKKDLPEPFSEKQLKWLEAIYAKYET